METAATHRIPGYVVPTGVGRGMLDAISQVHRKRSDKTVWFTTVGWLTKEKRLDTLVRAFRCADIPGSGPVIVGNGDQRPLLEILAAGTGNIDFRGHLRSLDAITYELVGSGVFVLTSHRFNSQALVFSGVVAAGLPILYCDDRLTVVTSPKSALLTKSNISSLAAGMRKLAGSERHAAMRSVSRGLLEELTSRRTAETYVSIHEELTRAKSA